MDHAFYMLQHFLLQKYTKVPVSHDLMQAKNINWNFKIQYTDLTGNSEMTHFGLAYFYTTDQPVEYIH